MATAIHLTKRDATETLESLLGDVKKAHHGLWAARTLCANLKETLGSSPNAMADVSKGFEAINALHSALKKLGEIAEAEGKGATPLMQMITGKVRD
jgi:hypothetical protein